MDRFDREAAKLVRAERARAEREAEEIKRAADARIATIEQESRRRQKELETRLAEAEDARRRAEQAAAAAEQSASFIFVSVLPSAAVAHSNRFFSNSFAAASIRASPPMTAIFIRSLRYKLMLLLSYYAKKQFSVTAL